jgi:hypothetical protein
MCFAMHGYETSAQRSDRGRLLVIVRAAGRCAIEGRSSCGPGQPARAATAKVALDTAAAAYPERLVWCPVSLAAGLQYYSIQKRKRWSPEEMIIVCVDVDGG